MAKNSLKKFLKKFPYFLNKTPESNFYKSQDVTNRRFQDIFQSLVDVYESFHLRKKCLIWKEQEREFDYIINFVANYPNLKSVKCYKNDKLIYMETYEEGDEQDTFHYSYICSYVNENISELKVFRCNTCGNLYLSRTIPEECTICNDSTFEKLNTYQCNTCGEIYFKDTLPEECSCDTPDFTLIHVYQCSHCSEIFLTENCPDNCPYCGESRYLEPNSLAPGNLAITDNAMYEYDLEEDIIASVIPTDIFRIEVETYDELFFEKGFPENDTLQGDVYDHDSSLDEIGALNNIPRKEYILVDESQYTKTEPPFNNRLSEDDYHYMNRILEYNLRLHDTPLPVLEIWKLYGLSAVMLNRERLLLKMFDERLHPFDKETGHVLDWTPEPWEHKDGLCNCVEDYGQYFFVTASTKFPKKFKPVTFTFKFLDSLNKALDLTYTVDVYLNCVSLASNVSEKTYTVNESLLQDTNLFRFVAKDNTGDIIGEVSLTVEVQGCNNADFYVNSNGSDDNSGKIDAPFLTVNKALSCVTNTKNLIVIQGDISLNSIGEINNNCTILGCNTASITNTNSNKFFKVNNNVTLSILDLTLNGKDSNTYVKASDFSNNNVNTGNKVIVRLPGDDLNQIQALHIQDLNRTDFVTDVRFDNHQNIVIVKTPLSDFTKLSDLEQIIVDVKYKRGNIIVERFESTQTDESILNGDMVDVEDLNVIYSAITDVVYSNGVLIKNRR